MIICLVNVINYFMKKIKSKILKLKKINKFDFQYMFLKKKCILRNVVFLYKYDFLEDFELLQFCVDIG